MNYQLAVEMPQQMLHEMHYYCHVEKLYSSRCQAAHFHASAARLGRISLPLALLSSAPGGSAGRACARVFAPMTFRREGQAHTKMGDMDTERHTDEGSHKGKGREEDRDNMGMG